MIVRTCTNVFRFLSCYVTIITFVVLEYFEIKKEHNTFVTLLKS